MVANHGHDGLHGELHDELGGQADNPHGESYGGGSRDERYDDVHHGDGMTRDDFHNILSHHETRFGGLRAALEDRGFFDCDDDRDDHDAIDSAREFLEEYNSHARHEDYDDHVDHDHHHYGHDDLDNGYGSGESYSDHHCQLSVYDGGDSDDSYSQYLCQLSDSD